MGARVRMTMGANHVWRRVPWGERRREEQRREKEGQIRDRSVLVKYYQAPPARPPPSFFFLSMCKPPPHAPATPLSPPPLVRLCVWGALAPLMIRLSQDIHFSSRSLLHSFFFIYLKMFTR
ncbi:unnamed protein product [Gadus morhua 'NCC']